MVRKMAILALTGFLVLPLHADKKEVEKSEPQVKTYAVEGMYCGMCAYKIQEAMSGIKGVQACEVDFEKNTMTLTLKDNFDLDAIPTAVEEVGYKATLQKDEEEESPPKEHRKATAK